MRRAAALRPACRSHARVGVLAAVAGIAARPLAAQPLTRAEAARVIEAYAAYLEHHQFDGPPARIDVPPPGAGRPSLPASCAALTTPPIPDAASTSTGAYEPGIHGLVRAGWLSVRETPADGRPGCTFAFGLRATAALARATTSGGGAARVHTEAPWHAEIERYPNGGGRIRLRTTRVNVREVTGVALEPGGTRARVDFTFAVTVNPCVPLAGLAPIRRGFRQTTLVLVRYDDGWRVDPGALLYDAPAAVRAGRPTAGRVPNPPLEGRTPETPCLEAGAIHGTPAMAAGVAAPAAASGTPPDPVAAAPPAGTAESVRSAAVRVLERLPLTPAERGPVTRALAEYLTPRRARVGPDSNGFYVEGCAQQVYLFAELVDLNADDTPEVEINTNLNACSRRDADSTGRIRTDPLLVPTALFVRGAGGQWAAALTMDGLLGALPTRTRGYLDLYEEEQACKVVFRWNGTRYVPVGRMAADKQYEAACLRQARDPGVPAALLPPPPGDGRPSEGREFGLPKFVRGRAGARPTRRP